MPWVRNNEVSALSANKQEFHEKGHSSLDLTMPCHVINLEYSWLGVNPEGVVHDAGCTDPNGLLDINFPYNYCESTHFIQHSEVFLLLAGNEHACFKRTTPLLSSSAKTGGSLLLKVLRICGFYKC